ncbi:hypothetical protein AMATHDRAFT_153931, partial [Amanita thiersii Skay4041]
LLQYVGFASFIVLVWDHIITFSDEVELMWKGRKGLFVYLFLLNRYLTPLSFIINLVGLSFRSFCKNFVRYEGCMFAIAIEIVGLMMYLRINALYPWHRWISRSLLLILVIETGVHVWLITRGEPVKHNLASGIQACTMIFDPTISSVASASAWIPLLYDTIVFALTIYRTLPPIWKRQASYILKRLFEDGLLYYSIIFSVAFVLTIMIVASPPGLKNIAAQ